EAIVTFDNWYCQLPFASAVVVPTFTPSRYTLTVALASEVPSTTGDVTLVALSPAGAESDAGSRCGAGGAGGAVASIVTVMFDDGVLTFPAVSSVTALTVCGPEDCVVVVTPQ